MYYQRILRPPLFLLKPDKVHESFISLGEKLGASPIARNIIGALYDYKGPDISKIVDGVCYRTPVVLSAGFDYNGRLTEILSSLGFGGVEVGSVTARPCAGNQPPHLMRLPRSKSILVRKGLKNDGVEAVIKRLKEKKKKPEFAVGISIARTNDKESSEADDGIEDYCYSLRRCLEEKVGDYYAVNISCPNTFTGEIFTHPELLDRLLSQLSVLKSDKPLYVKMSINKEWEEFQKLLEVIVSHKMNGVIIGNLNKYYNELDFPSEVPADLRGGVSGKPCQKRSTDLIKRTRKEFGNRFTVMGCGGVMSPEDAREKMEAGADLIQLITGMIYEGPGLIKKICASLADEKRN